MSRKKIAHGNELIPLLQHWPQTESRFAEESTLVRLWNKGKFVAGQVVQFLETAVVGGGKVRAPHHPAGAEAVQQAAEKLPGVAPPP